jgi:acyl transferase domain-containing protein
MVGRFPDAPDVESLWRNILAGCEGIKFFRDDELDASVPPEIRRDPAYVKAKGLLAESDLFDASFFDITPLEARVMDPQHRVLLELAWAALERSGHRSSDFAGSIGVYVGANWNRYRATNVAAHPDVVANFGELNTAIANEQDFLATRISYKLDLKGPSNTVNTACSTSLVAIAQAARALANGDCDLALAGGVSITVPINAGYLHEPGGMLSKDGHCRPFDADCSGTTFNDGAGVVALRRLQDAIDDGDHIHAVIRGCAIGNDGASKVSFTAPSVTGQAAVLTAALKDASVDPATVGYIEAHGTATPMGDPIELAALNRAYGGPSDANQKCALGSVKSSIGHLVHAAGVVGFITAVLAVENGIIPPTLFYRTPNPRLKLGSSRFYVATAPQTWGKTSHPRRAGVSSFGVGGANAHVVIEQAPPVSSVGGGVPMEEADDQPLQVLCLSAKTKPALIRQIKAQAQFLGASPVGLALPAVARTLQFGRETMRYRCALVASSLADSASALRNTPPIVDVEHPRRLAFLFSGYGSQQQGMARQLHEQSPVFRADLDHGIALVLAAGGPDIAPYLLEDEAGGDPVPVDVRTTLPALFVFLHALTVTLERAGLRAETLIGCSIGEFAAAVAGGVMSFDDAVKLVVVSSAATFRMPVGSMLTVLCSEPEARLIAAPGVSIAAVHAENVVGLSGPSPAIEATRLRLEAEGLVTTKVASDRAFHSAMIEPIALEIERQFAGIVLSSPKCRIVSSASGADLTSAQAKAPSYWAHILSRPIRFAEALGQLGNGEDHILVEVGPGTGLTALALIHPDARHSDPIAVLPSGGSERQALGELYGAVTHCWLHGGVSQVATSRAGMRAQLPTYCFERTRHWLAPPVAALATSESLLEPLTTMASQLQAVSSGELPERLGALKNMIERQNTLMRSQLQVISAVEARVSGPLHNADADAET